MNKEQQRKEFEEWAKTQRRIREGLKLIRDSEGNYMSDDAEIAWDAWQAAQKELTEQRDTLAEAVNAATILIAAKGRHNTMLAYEGLRETLKSITTTEP
jgi:hypothetical protein